MSNKRCVTRREAIAAPLLAASCALAATDAASAEEAQLQVLNSSESIEFLYIDNAELSVGGTQNVVACLSGYAGVDSATLVVVNVDSGAETTYEMSATADSSVLFTYVPQEGGSCRIDGLQFSSAGSSYTVDFSDGDTAARSYVVSAAAARSVAEEEPTLQVYSSDSAGEVTEYSTVEDGADAAVETTPGATTPEDIASDVDVEAAAASVASYAVRTASVRTARSGSGQLVVAIDPGHYGRESGTTYPGRTSEATCNFKIASACKAALDAYDNVKAVLTVQQGQTIPVSNARDELLWRVQSAVSQGADVMVCIHINSGGGSGAEVYVPYNGSYNNGTHTVGNALGKQIITELEKLGLYNRGVKISKATGSSYEYADGSDGDYYGIIRYSRQQNLPCVLVEHAFLDNASDYNNFLSNDSKLTALGQADARGIINYYGLTMVPGTVYRLYNPNNGMHHYTTDSNEYRVLGGVGWHQEGRAWIAPDKTESSQPVYRLYNPSSGDHLYTTDANEYKTLARVGWRQEGTCWYSAPSNSGVAIYRLFNPHASVGTHLYTLDANEYRTLPGLGWRQEGVAWYGKSS